MNIEFSKWTLDLHTLFLRFHCIWNHFCYLLNKLADSILANSLSVKILSLWREAKRTVGTLYKLSVRGDIGKRGEGDHPCQGALKTKAFLWTNVLLHGLTYTSIIFILNDSLISQQKRTFYFFYLPKSIIPWSNVYAPLTTWLPIFL